MTFGQAKPYVDSASQHYLPGVQEALRAMTNKSVVPYPRGIHTYPIGLPDIRPQIRKVLVVITRIGPNMSRI